MLTKKLKMEGLWSVIQSLNNAQARLIAAKAFPNDQFIREGWSVDWQVGE